MKTESADFHNQHFDSIQALRGIAALFIVLEHIQFLNCGAFAVDIFFCISGFMIMFSTHNDTKNFLGKRLVRILPLYYLMTLGTFLFLVLFPDMFHQSKANPVFLLKSLLFIPFDIGDGVIQPLMRVGWTINCEIVFYLLFFVALKISHKYRGLICSVFLLLLTAAAWLFPELCVPLSFYGNPVMLEFIYGIILYYAAEKLYRLHQSSALPRIGLHISISGIVGCFLWLLITKPDINILGLRRPIVWGLPATAIVLFTFLVGLYIRRIPAVAVQLGNASFSLYMMHYYPVMLLDRMIFDFSSCSPYAFLGVAAAIAVSVSLALVSREFLEKRLTRFLYGHLF